MGDRLSNDRAAPMITVRRTSARRYERRRDHQCWLTFFPNGPLDPLAEGFETLEGLSEHRIGPRASALPPQATPFEAITYVREGRLVQTGSTGHAGIISAGEFQRRAVGPGPGYVETNASRSTVAQLFRISLRCRDAYLEPSHEQKRFSVAERRGRLCLVASRDARDRSLRLDQDVRVFSGLLDPGQHRVHALLPGRRAWLHVVQGELTLGGLVLFEGDGAGVTAEPVSVTSREPSEILLVDVGAP